MLLLTMPVMNDRLKKKIIKDKYNAIIFEKGKGRDLYLVGGYVRDVLRGLPSLDRDFILKGDLVSFAGEIRKLIGGTLVKFKSEDTVRLAFQGGLTFDFSRHQGMILQEDLSKRDFSINAMAWSPGSGIIDPFNGIGDLQKKRIRTLGRNNLLGDPLRMLRAYRFASELNGFIERRTRHLIKMLHDGIKEISSERITLEFFHLLNSKQSAKYLKTALADGLLGGILSFPLRHLEDNIRALSDLEKKSFNILPHRIKVSLNKIFSQNLTYKGLLCLEALLCNHIPLKDADHRLTMSRAIHKRLELTAKGLKEFRREISKDRIFNAFIKSKEASIDLLILERRYDLLSEYGRYRKLWKDGYLNAGEIMEISGITEGSELGYIIASLRRAEFGKRVRSKAQAIVFLKEHFVK